MLNIMWYYVLRISHSVESLVFREKRRNENWKWRIEHLVYVFQCLRVFLSWTRFEHSMSVWVFLNSRWYLDIRCFECEKNPNPFFVLAYDVRASGNVPKPLCMRPKPSSSTFDNAWIPNTGRARIRSRQVRLAEPFRNFAVLAADQYINIIDIAIFLFIIFMMKYTIVLIHWQKKKQHDFLCVQ